MRFFPQEVRAHFNVPRPSLDFEMVFTGGEVGSLAVASRGRVFEKWGTNRRRFRVPRILKEFADEIVEQIL